MRRREGARLRVGVDRLEAVMERQRENGQTAARQRATASAPRERHTTLAPRTTRRVPSMEPPLPPLSPHSTPLASPRGPRARSLPPRGPISGPLPRGPRSGPLAPSYGARSGPLTQEPSTALTSYAEERQVAPYGEDRPGGMAPVILSPTPTRSIAVPITPKREPTIKPWMRLTAGLIAVVACIVGVLGFQLVHPAAVGDKASGATSVNVNGTPEPSGRGPLTATIGVIVAMPAPKAQHGTQGTGPTPSGSGSYIAYGLSSIQPCHDSVKFLASVSQWSVPPGCYANIYKPNPANYPARASWGWCNWWVEETHPQDPNITGNTRYRRGTVPVANAAIFIDGGEQGAGPAGHWVESVAVSPGGYWILISEMNFAWRGAGWGLIDYRYIHVSPHVHFLYGV
jgi:hypothetical protein